MKERRTEDRGHDPYAWIYCCLIGAADAEFGKGRKAGWGELGAAAFGWHCSSLVCTAIEEAFGRRVLSSQWGGGEEEIGISRS